MKKIDLYENLSGIDEKFITESAPDAKAIKKPRKISRWIALAACLCVVISSVLIAVPLMKKDKGNSTADTLYWNDTRERKDDVHIMENEIAYVFPWEYLNTEEKFSRVTFNEKEYSIMGKVKDEKSIEFLGESAGIATAYGRDLNADNKIYSQECKVFSIKNVDTSKSIWVKFEGDESYYIYCPDEYNPPVDLSQFLDSLNFTEYVKLTYFTIDTGSVDEICYSLSETATKEFWEMLKGIDGAKFEEDNNFKGRAASFRIDSDILGISNLSMSVFSDGYIHTNAQKYGYNFFIGEEIAANIINFLNKNKEEVYELKNRSIAGEVVEIGDGFIKIDDSIIMKDKKDGIIFTVNTSSLTLKRYFDLGLIKVGDTVLIEHGGITVDNNSFTINTATSIHKGQIFENVVIIPE